MYRVKRNSALTTDFVCKFGDVNHSSLSGLSCLELVAGTELSSSYIVPRVSMQTI